MKSTTTVVSKDSSLVVYIQQQIYRVFHIIRQHFFFRFFWFWFSNIQWSRRKNILCFFESKEEAAVGAKKKLCNRIDFNFDNIWFDLIELI